MNVVFVYAGGRESRWEEAKQGRSPSEFFYGAVEFALSDTDTVQVVDVPLPKKGLGIALLDAFIGKMLPARTNAASLIQVLRILPRLRSADCVIATYTQAALVLGLLRWFKILRKPLLGVHCGLVNHSMSRRRTWLTKKALQASHTVLFAKSEKSQMQQRFELKEAIITSGDFGVDLNFWTPDSHTKKESFILAIGNDSRRDYMTLLIAAKKVDREFRLVTRLPLPDSLPGNVQRVQGDWKGAVLSDEMLREMYRKAAMVVIPLFESPQPSGQSVAMQAIACGTPIIMTKTSGDWTSPILDKAIQWVKEGDDDGLAAAIEKLRVEVLPEEARKRLLEAQWDGIGFAQRLRQVCLQAIGSRNV